MAKHNNAPRVIQANFRLTREQKLLYVVIALQIITTIVVLMR